MGVTMFESTEDSRIVNNLMRHSYRVLSDSEKADVKLVKDLGIDFTNFCNDLQVDDEQQAMLKNAIDRVQEAVFWAVKAITK